MAKIIHHRTFEEQFKQLAGHAENQTAPLYETLFYEIAGLLEALGTYGHEIEGHEPDDESHPLLESRYQTFALRRTPPTLHTPKATKPPVLRIPYTWFNTPQGELAVIWRIANKTESANNWYKPTANKIDNELIPRWVQDNPSHKPRTRH